MMVLPATWDRSFREELKRVQEENRMRYITGFERDGMAIMTRENTIEVLQTRFGVIPDELSSQIQEIEDLAVLKRLFKQSITIASVEEFGRLVDEVRSHLLDNLAFRLEFVSMMWK